MPALRLLAAERVRRDAQVVLDRELRQQPPAFGDDRHTGSRAPLGPPARRSRSPSSTRPAVGRRMPATASTSDDLPAPFGPEQSRDLARRDLERDVAHDRPPAARDHRPPVAARRAGDRGAAACARSQHLLGAEVGAHHVLVAQHLGGRPGSDQPAEVQHRGRLQQAETRLMSWSTRITSAPNGSGSSGSRRPGARSPRREARRGSSSSTTRGLPTTARAISTRRRSRAPSPADPDLRRRLEPDELDRAETSPAREERWRPSARGPSRRCRTPTAPRSPSPSGTSAAAPSARGGSRPSRAGPRRKPRIDPAAGLTKPLRTLKNVVLPAPFGPIRPHVPPGKTTLSRRSG